MAIVACASVGNQDPVANLRTVTSVEAIRFAEEMGRYVANHGEEKALATAQESVKRQLKDPDSAKFQGLRFVDYPGAGKVVCGEVNAKNSYGGYVGFKRFVAGTSGARMFDTSSQYPVINDAANTGIVAACGD